MQNQQIVENFNNAPEREKKNASRGATSFEKGTSIAASISYCAIL